MRVQPYTLEEFKKCFKSGTTFEALRDPEEYKFELDLGSNAPGAE